MLDQRVRKAEMHLTYKCDLDCPGCNRACFNKHSIPPDMTKQTFVHTLDEIERLGFMKTLVIIGGEPTLHRDCVDFLRIGHDRGFEQHLWSNSYSQLAKDKVATVREEGLARVIEGTHKLNGAMPGFNNPSIFCSPADLGVTRSPCKWGDGTYGCGYSVDEQGCTPCPIGGMIAHYTARQLLVSLRDLEPIEMHPELCKHCGAFTKPNDRETTNVNGTSMTKTWMEIFK